ncbi:MAG: sigma-70 family RNA polymerase sigma factor [Verrucomicrobia bacterium]|nr:sigma-70 family RNA polymerase sigma factor [Verrucomicrobiota bacterium]
MSLPEIESPAAATAGEPWRELFRSQAPRLLLYARQFAHEAAGAEDIVQEAFVRCWQRYGEGGRTTPALLFSAARTIGLDHLRARARRQQREAAVAPDPAAAEWFACPAEEAERAEAIALALQRLPSAQREVVVLRIWGDLRFAEIASVLAIPEDTASSRFRYALAALRDLLPASLLRP